MCTHVPVVVVIEPDWRQSVIKVELI